MKIAVIGTDGQLGSDLLREFKNDLVENGSERVME